MFCTSGNIEISKNLLELSESLKANNLTDIAITSQSSICQTSTVVFTSAPLENKISRFKVQCVGGSNAAFSSVTVTSPLPSINTLSSSGASCPNLENQSIVINPPENIVGTDLNINNPICQVPASSHNLTTNFSTSNNNVGHALNHTIHLHPHEFTSTLEHLASELRKVSGVEPHSCTSSTISNVIFDSSNHLQHHNVQPTTTPAPSYTSVSHTPNLETVISLEPKTSGTTIDVNHHLFGLNEKLQALQTEQQQDSLVQVVANSGLGFSTGSGGGGSSESTVDDFQKLQQQLQQSHQSLNNTTSLTGANGSTRVYSSAPFESLHATHLNCTGTAEDIDLSLHSNNTGSNLLTTSSAVIMPQVDTLNELASALQKVLKIFY